MIDDKELYLFNEKTKACRQVDYGDLGKEYMNEVICNVAVAYNSKFFAIGIPSKRAFGIFKIERVFLKVTPPNEWITKVSFVLGFNYLLVHFRQLLRGRPSVKRNVRGQRKKNLRLPLSSLELRY